MNFAGLKIQNCKNGINRPVRNGLCRKFAGKSKNPSENYMRHELVKAYEESENKYIYCKGLERFIRNKFKHPLYCGIAYDKRRNRTDNNGQRSNCHRCGFAAL